MASDPLRIAVNDIDGTLRGATEYIAERLDALTEATGALTRVTAAAALLANSPQDGDGVAALMVLKQHIVTPGARNPGSAP